MSVGTTTALVLGGIGAAGSLGGALIGANASKTAANQQVTQEDKALQLQQQQLALENANQAPFISSGQSSIGKLMELLNNGTYGPGSIGPAPTFTTPTLADAQATPGYQFTQQQGEQGIERGAAAAGGAFTGGTLKNLAGYDTNLADTTYGNIFNRALQQYGASMGTYQQNLATQAQGFNQLLAPAQLGESAAANAANAGNQTTAQIANTFGNIGGTQAAGTIGQANAINSGIGGVVNSATLPLYLQALNNNPSPSQPFYPTNSPNLTQYGAVPPGWNPDDPGVG